MKILITGASGLIGTALATRLREKGHLVKELSRRTMLSKDQYNWNLDQNYIDTNALRDVEVILHLAGASIGQHWTEDYKEELYNSRIQTAEMLFQYCKRLNVHLNAFITAGGINYYGTYTSDKILTETDDIQHQDFLSQLGKDWEAVADQFTQISDRVVKLRTALVLASKGGGFEKIKKTVDYHVGSGLGSGKQWVTWIHLDDLVEIYVTAVENQNINGAYNALADEIPSQKIFMKKLAKACGKFLFPLNMPSFMLKMMFGEMSEVLLKGTRASNQKIKDAGFKFKFPRLEEAFGNLIRK